MDWIARARFAPPSPHGASAATEPPPSREEGPCSYTPRTAFLIARDPDDPLRRVLACTKNNLAVFPPSLGFRIVGVPAVWPASSGSVLSCGLPTNWWARAAAAAKRWAGRWVSCRSICKRVGWSVWT